MINKNLKAKELCTVGTKEDSFNECQDASSRALGSRAKRACQGCFVTMIDKNAFGRPLFSFSFINFSYSIRTT